MPIAIFAIVGAALAAALFFFSRNAQGATMHVTPQLSDLYAKYGARYGVDPDLLRALAIVESSERADAVRNRPPNDISVGLMQVLCIPDEKGNCTNKLNVDGWPTTFNALLNPEVNVMIAAQIIAWNISAFGFKRGIAVYNRWLSRNDPPEGPFGNQSYVDKVLKHYTLLKGA